MFRPRSRSPHMPAPKLPRLYHPNPVSPPTSRLLTFYVPRVEYTVREDLSRHEKQRGRHVTRPRSQLCRKSALRCLGRTSAAMWMIAPFSLQARIVLGEEAFRQNAYAGETLVQCTCQRSH